MNKALKVEMQRSSLLAFHRTKHRVHAPKDAPCGHSTATEAVHARAAAFGAVRAAGAKAHPKKMSQSQDDENFKPFCTS